jgi:biopolymer transport protein ExbD
MLARFDLPEDARIQKTVFIKAPRGIPYGEVVRVMDGLKGAGAEPIGLQLDDLK